jgi:hypothetical protein
MNLQHQFAEPRLASSHIYDAIASVKRGNTQGLNTADDAILHLVPMRLAGASLIIGGHIVHLEIQDYAREALGNAIRASANKGNLFELN